MKRRIAFIALLSSLAYVWAAPLTVAFLDGKVELKAGLSWKTVDIGDSVPENAVLRLSKGAVLEMDGQSGRVLISTQGTYDLATFKPAKRDSRVAEVLKKLAAGGTAENTVAGVRGAEAGGAGDVVWMTGEDNADLDADAGYQKMRNAAYEEASRLFGDAIKAYKARDNVPEDMLARCAYFAGYCATRSGSEGAALAWLRNANPARAGDLRGPYALLLATLEAAGGSKEQAKAVLDKGLSGAWFGKDEETARGILASLK